MENNLGRRLQRMEDTKCVKNFFESKLQNDRAKLRSILMWLDNIEGDLQELGIENWKNMPKNRTKRAGLVEEANKRSSPSGVRRQNLS